jgi:hypothetical protein
MKTPIARARLAVTRRLCAAERFGARSYTTYILGGFPMKRLALLLLVLVSPLGCKKALDTTPGPDEKVKVIPSGAGDLSGGGAIQAPRNTAARIANTSNLDQMHKLIYAAIQEDTDERIPDAKQVMQIIRQFGPAVKMVNEEILILTNNTTPQGIIAYTKWPQRAGNHFIITKSGWTDITPAKLAADLKAQGSVVKLEK